MSKWLYVFSTHDYLLSHKLSMMAEYAPSESLNVQKSIYKLGETN